MIKSGIYAIINIINNKMYIGSTVNFVQRKKQHYSLLKNNKHENKYLQKSYNKYGINNFQFIILEKCEDIITLMEREKYWIILKNTLNKEYGYNLMLPDPLQHHFHAEETKELLRQRRYENLNIDLNYENWKESIKNKYIIKKENIIKNKENLIILQIDKITGDVMKEFLNVGQVCKEMNYKKVNKVKDVLQNRLCSYRGFVYVYKYKYDFNKNYKIEKNRQYTARIKPIFQYDDSFNIIKEWKGGVIEISNFFNIKKNTLYYAVSKKRKFNNYYWYSNKI